MIGQSEATVARAYRASGCSFGNDTLTDRPLLVRGGGPPAGESDGHRTRIIDRIRQAVRVRQLSRRTERAYAGWNGYDIRTIQELLGHKSVTTTMIYSHVLNRGQLGVRSPADHLRKHS